MNSSEEDRLRSVMARRVADVSASPGALDSIRARAAGSGGRRRAPWLAAAAGVLVVVGAVAFAARPDTADVRAAASTTTADTTASTPSTAIAPAAADELPAGALWPIGGADSPLAAAQAFTSDVLGLPASTAGTDPEGSGPVLLLRPDEDGRARRGVAMFTSFERNGRHYVTGMTSVQQIDAPEQPVRGRSVRVAGRGTGYEASATLEVFALTESSYRSVGQSIVQVGAYGAEPFSAEVAIDVPPAATRGLVILRAAGGDDSGVTPTSVIGIALAATAPTAGPVTAEQARASIDADLDWSVVLVDRDDVLNVRASPSATAAIVERLAPDADVPEASSVTAANAGQAWRFVRTGTGDEGWVNARYLVARPADLGDDDRAALVGEARQLVAWAGSEVAALPPVSDRGVWFAGNGVYADLPIAVERVTGLDDPAVWRRSRTWPPGEPDARCGAACTKSPLELLRLPLQPGADPTYAYEPEGATMEPNRAGADPRLAPAPHVVVRVPTSNDQELDWLDLRVYFDFSQGPPRIWAAQVEVWAP